MSIILNVKQLTPDSFAKYGQVIGLPAEPADKNKIQRWADVSAPDFQGGRPVIDLLYSNQRPLKVEKLERHRNSTQTFIPLSQSPFLVVVGEAKIAEAGKNDFDPSQLEAFISNGRQGITLAAGIWHGSPLPIGNSIEFSVLHRSPDVDLDIQLITLDANSELMFSF